MHPNPVFRKTEEARNIAFAQEQAFGMVSVNADPAPLISHIPFLVSDDGKRVEAHFVRSNPIARALRAGPLAAVVAVQGPHGYISPDWYGLDDQVPTWNYVAVHLRGELRLLETDELRGVLDRLSAAMEARLLPKKPWRIDKMDAGARDAMMRQIVPVALRVDQIDATWKLGQNKPDQARLRAASERAVAGGGMEAGDLSGLMQEPPA